MEEVDALASRVGIIASKMLAVGTPTSLKNRFATVRRRSAERLRTHSSAKSQ
jgi:ABC-type multidrug transport system ATPase subunit